MNTRRRDPRSGLFEAALWGALPAAVLFLVTAAALFDIPAFVLAVLFLAWIVGRLRERRAGRPAP